jgi:hypothetical protein
LRALHSSNLTLHFQGSRRLLAQLQQRHQEEEAANHALLAYCVHTWHAYSQQFKSDRQERMKRHMTMKKIDGWLLEVRLERQKQQQETVEDSRHIGGSCNGGLPSSSICDTAVQQDQDGGGDQGQSKLGKGQDLLESKHRLHVLNTEDTLGADAQLASGKVHAEVAEIAVAALPALQPLAALAKRRAAARCKNY